MRKKALSDLEIWEAQARMYDDIADLLKEKEGVPEDHPVIDFTYNIKDFCRTMALRYQGDTEATIEVGSTEIPITKPTH